MKYVTLVFGYDTPEDKERVRDMANSELCRAWSIDNELLRLELIEKALDENDIEKARSYIGLVGVDAKKSDLEDNQQ